MSEKYPNPSERKNMSLKAKVIAAAGLVAVSAYLLEDFKDRQDIEWHGIQTEVAQPSDSIWSLTEKFVDNTEEVNMQNLINEIKEHNPGLEDGLQVGEQIELPKKVS